MFRFSIVPAITFAFCMTATAQHGGAAVRVPASYAPLRVVAPGAPTFVARPNAGIGTFSGNWAARGNVNRINGFRRAGLYGGFGGFTLVGGGYDDGQDAAPAPVGDDYYPYPIDDFSPLPPLNLLALPPLPSDHPTTARVEFQAPTGAEVWLQGKKVDAGGGVRIFESPALKADETYTFDIRVVWRENGKEMDEKHSLKVKPGISEGLKYLSSPAPALAPTPVVTPRKL